MALHLTPQIVRVGYGLFLETPPFDDWDMPEPEEVRFIITRSIDARGDWDFRSRRHIIRVSQRCHSTLHMMQMTLAHEMCHVRDYLLGTPKSVKHGSSWHWLADQVCRVHGFDRGAF